MATRSTPSRMSYGYPASLAYSLGQPILSKTYEYLPISDNFVNASIVAFVSLALFMGSFASPYWLVSYEYTYSEFKNNGLWEFCFDGYRYPKYQFDHKFVGCNYIFSTEYRIIWEWILPVWFMATQLFMTLALVGLLVTMLTSSLLVTRWPLQWVMRHEWRLMLLCAGAMAATDFCIVLSLIIFGVMCWSRDWLQNPNYNYLGWSYYFALFSGAFGIVAALMMAYETAEARRRKREGNSLLNMETNGHLGSLGSVPEIPMDNPPSYNPTHPPQYNPAMGHPGPHGFNMGYSREQSLYSQGSAFSQPPHRGAYM